MTKRCLILLLSFFSIFHGNEVVDSVFERSNELYIVGDFNGAINGYLSILDQEINNQVLYYNIGNSYYKLDQLGYAKLYYEKARITIPKDSDLMEDIIHNINFLDTQLVDDINSLPEFFVVKISNDIQSVFSNNTWAVITIIALYLTLFLLLIFIFSSSQRIKTNSIKSLFFIVPIFLIVLFFLTLNSNHKTGNYGVLIAYNTYVKTAPSSSSSDYFIIHEGLKFEIVDELDDWSRVVLPDGKDGWIENEHFRRIN